MFKDRTEAGKRLAAALADYQGEDIIVLAIPRGGVEVGYPVAKALEADFSLVLVRQLPLPDNPEAGFGALAEDGSWIVDQQVAYRLPAEAIERVVEFQRQEIERRLQGLRKGRPLPDLAGETVILVDDGITAAATMQVAIKLCRGQGAGRIVVAVPVAGERAARQIKELVDEIVVLEEIDSFQSMAQAYEDWHDLLDREARHILETWRSERSAGTS